MSSLTPSNFTEPATSSFVVGLDAPIPIFPPDEVIPDVLPSSSNKLSIILFQELDESPEPVPTLSDNDNPEENAAYPIERMVTVRKKENPVMIPLLKGDEGFIEQENDGK